MWHAGESLPKRCSIIFIFSSCISNFCTVLLGSNIALTWMRSAMGDEAYSRVKNRVQDKGLNATLCNFKG